MFYSLQKPSNQRQWKYNEALSGLRTVTTENIIGQLQKCTELG